MRPSRAILLLLLTATFPTLLAQQTAAPATIPALFLSDIHFDPYADPVKVARLNAASATDWPSILEAPDSPTRAADFAALQSSCPVRGVDTPASLWRSTLTALHSKAANTTFVTLSGDLLAHQFDCKFRTLLPPATHADYLAFTEKTVSYIVSSLRATLPGVPVYIALGNNDSGCTDYALDPSNDAFLARIAPIVADALPTSLSPTDRAAAQRDFAAGGYYSVPLAGVPNTRIVVLDDLYFSTEYKTCAGQPDPAPAAAQLAWLQSQLADARNHNQRVWVLAHIPPGVNIYASIRKAATVCTSGPQMYLASNDLSDWLAAYPDVIRLAIFGHSHSDEMRLLTKNVSSRAKASQRDAAVEEPALSSSKGPAVPAILGVPLKIVASITPVNGNNPTFTLARVAPSTATLTDYTVVEASNQTGIAATWSPEYTYSAAYHQPAFDSASLTRLFAEFRSDPSAASSASQNYITSYEPAAPTTTTLLKLGWPMYTCALDSFTNPTACACPK